MLINYLYVLKVFFLVVWLSKIQVCVSEIIDFIFEFRLRVEGYVVLGLVFDGVLLFQMMDYVNILLFI